MIISDISQTTSLSAHETDVLRDNLRAFIDNFGPVRLERAEVGPGWYVFYPADKTDNSWIQYCYDINYLNGWLYGIVQGKHRPEFADNIGVLDFIGPEDENGDKLTEGFVILTKMNRKEINDLARTIAKIKKGADLVSEPDYDHDNFLSKQPDVEGFTVPPDWNTLDWSTKIITISNYLSATKGNFRIAKAHGKTQAVD